MKKPLYLRNDIRTFQRKGKYLKIVKKEGDFIIGLRHINALYLSNSIVVRLKDLADLGLKIPVFIVDNRGYILVRIGPEELE